MVELKNICVKQGNKIVLDNYNWKINKGERWVILGTNGCGKTTLASIIATYKGNYEGQVKIFGEELNEKTAIQLRKRIGFASESYFSNCLSKELGMEIILGAVSGQLCEQDGITDDDVRHAKKLLQAFGIGVRGEYPYDLLSKGQQERVLLARAFMRPKELLILDEPCTGLDILSRIFLSNTLSDLVEHSNTTLVYITHHTEEITSIFTHALLMKKGKIHSQGEIMNVLNSENMTDFFEKPTDAFWENGYLNVQIKNNFKMDRELWQNYGGKVV